MDVVSEYRYTRQDRIDGGEGQNSIGVFRAIDPQLQAVIAVKEIDKATFRDPSDYFMEAHRMFRSEHPNVVAIRTAVQQPDRICLAMPLFARGSLGARIKDNGLSLSSLRTVGRHILAGVGAIHASDSIHFDIKPSNVLFSDAGVAMIADFGQAREVGPNGVTLMPKLMYGPMIPPEALIHNRRGTKESDIYQVGLTLWRACNGDRIYNEQIVKHGADLQQAIVAGRFPKRDFFLPHIPNRMRRAIKTAMQVDPNRRFHDSVEFANALTKVKFRHDWTPCELPDDEHVWDGVRKNAAPLRVRLTGHGRTWTVAPYTCSNGKERAMRGTLRRDKLKRSEALMHLRCLFALLG